MKKHFRWLANSHTLSNLFVVFAGITFYLFWANCTAIFHHLNGLSKILRPFIIGFAVAYLLNIPVRYMEEKVFAKFRAKRGLSILTVYAIALACLGVLLGAVIPQVIQSVVDLVNNTELYLKNLNGLMLWIKDKFGIDQAELEPLFLSYKGLISNAVSMLTNALPQVLNFGVALGSGLVTTLTALIASIYMLSSKHSLISQLKRIIYAILPKPRADEMLRVSRHANDIFSGFVGGKIIDSVIIGILCFIGMNLFGMEYALLISIVVGVTNVIPFFGPFIGAVPSVMILLIVDPRDAIYFAIFVLALQQFDGNILGPKILGDSTGLSAIWVLVAIIVGGGLFGFTGMLLGVPTFAVIYSLTKEWVTKRLHQKGLDENGNIIPPPEPEEEITAPVQVQNKVEG